MIRLVAPLTVVGGGDRALSRSKHTLSMAARARPPLRTSEGGLPGRPARAAVRCASGYRVAVRRCDRDLKNTRPLAHGAENPRYLTHGRALAVCCRCLVVKSPPREF